MSRCNWCGSTNETCKRIQNHLGCKKMPEIIPAKPFTKHLENQPKKSGGWSSDYYRIPEGATELDDLIVHKNMDWHQANIFKACYRLGDKNSEEYELDKIAWMLMRKLKTKGLLQKFKDNLAQEFPDEPQP